MYVCVNLVTIIKQHKKGTSGTKTRTDYDRLYIYSIELYCMGTDTFIHTSLDTPNPPIHRNI